MFGFPNNSPYLSTMEFRKLSIQEFNSLYNTALEKGMTFDQSVKEIEDAIVGEDIFYISMRGEDVEEAVEEFSVGYKLDNIYVGGVGVFVSLVG